MSFFFSGYSGTTLRGSLRFLLSPTLPFDAAVNLTSERVYTHAKSVYIVYKDLLWKEDNLVYLGACVGLACRSTSVKRWRSCNSSDRSKMTVVVVVVVIPPVVNSCDTRGSLFLCICMPLLIRMLLVVLMIINVLQSLPAAALYYWWCCCSSWHVSIISRPAKAGSSCHHFAPTCKFFSEDVAATASACAALPFHISRSHSDSAKDLRFVLSNS